MDLTALRHTHAWAERIGIRLAPKTSEQVAALLHDAQTNRKPIALSEMEAAHLPEPVWLDLSALSTVRRYRVDDLTLQVETGITMGELARLTRASGQTFPLQYPDETPLIEVIAEDRPALETGLSAGYPRDYLLKVEVATPDGQLTHYGADVVKNATGYDLNKLYAGSQHTLAVITAVTLKLLGAPESRQDWVIGYESLAAAAKAVSALQQSSLPLTRCEIFHHNRLNAAQQRKVNQPWLILLRLNGDHSHLTEAKERLKTVLSGTDTLEPLTPARERSLLKQLSHWQTTLLAEVAIPAGSWQAFADTLPPSPLSLRQIRPAAGLLYFSAEVDTAHNELSTALTRLNRTAQDFGGFLTLPQFPDELQPLATQLNLPDDPLVRQLMERLKAAYDPQEILYSRRLPLRAKQEALP